MKPLPTGSNINADDVTLLQRIAAWDSVDHHVVHTDAGTGWKTAVTQE